MLITNFSAGELSKTLFGRIDIQQYFGGASYIENFDVIPTGGIKRRSGTERIAQLEEDGRIIPFIVDREHSFLIYLAAGKMKTLKLHDGKITGTQEFENGAGLKLFDKLEDVRAAQYAQNFDTMILCHEKYPPIEIRLEKTGSLNVKTVAVDNGVKVKATNAEENEIKGKFPDDIKDKLYEENGYLRGEGNYPRCVTFYNGRLIFAGTANNPQRIFASRILTDKDKIAGSYPFATYDFFGTKNKKYVSILGEVNPENTAEIILNDIYERLKFTDANLWEYAVDSPFYPADTRIVRLEGDRLELSNPGQAITPLTSAEREALEAMIINYDNYLNKKEYHVPEHYENNVYVAGIARIVYSEGAKTSASSIIRLNVGINEFYVKSAYVEDEMKFFDDDAARTITADSLYNRFLSEVNNKISLVINHLLQWPKVSILGIDIYHEKLREAADETYRRIRETMMYNFRGTLIYGKPRDILAELVVKYGVSKMYVNFYTVDYVSDRYPTPDCGFTFEIASDMNDSIRWITANKGLIVGTEAGEWIIPTGVHAANVQAALNSRFGSDRIQGVAVGDATVYLQTGKKSLVEYYIPQQDNNFRANNMAMMSMQMLRESAAVEFDFISSPYIKLLITREDGIVACLLYERGTGTFAWSRIAVGEGRIKSAAVLPSADGNDDAYFLVNRTNGFFLERLREEGEVYLDGYSAWSGGRSGYTEEAVVYDELDNKVYGPEESPDASPMRYIGYPYTSRVRSMPILANDKMKPNNVKNLSMRFLDSYMPKLKSIPNGKTDVICTPQEPYSGTYRVPFPGVWGNDVMFEFIHVKPSRCLILAINTEVN